MRSLLFTAVCALPALAQAPVELRLGVTPGRVDARLSGLPSGALVGLLLGLETGSSPLPGGLSLDLVPLAVGALGFLDAQGQTLLTMRRPVGTAAGLHFHAQAVAYDPRPADFATGPLQVTPMRSGQVPELGEVVDLVVLFGQSNAAGMVPTSELPSALQGIHPQVRIWNDARRAWEPLHLGHNNQLVPQSPHVGPELGMVETGSGSAPVWLVKVAQAQSSLGPQPGPWNEWGCRAGELYPALLQRIRDAGVAAQQLGLSPRVRLLAMMQGETDSCDPVLAAAYAENLREMLVQLRSDLQALGLCPAGEPHVRLGLVHPALQRVGCPGTVTVRAAQVAVAAQLPHCEVVETRDLSLQPDHVHFTLAGLRGLGRVLLRPVDD